MGKNNSFKKPILLAFTACFLYWIYLFFTCRMVISCDAICYEELGKLLYEKGWIEYFKTGPNREPFYPFLISIAMWIGNHFSISYQPIMIVLQLLTVLLTQLIALYVMLRILKINGLIASLTILYLGISPAIVGSALSLFSEIATYPLMLITVLVTYYSWLSFNKSKSRIIISAVLSGFVFCLMALSKVIFEAMIPVYILSVFFLAVFTRKQKIIRHALIYAITSLIVFCGLVNGYKLENKIYNHNFMITNNRGDVKFYGTAVRRTDPLTTEKFLIALACVPGEGFCRSIFGNEKCSYWGFEVIDGLGFYKLSDLINSGVPSKDTGKPIINLAIKRVLQNPAQYALFWVIEGFKMFCWESTHVGFVSYPAILNKIFNWKLIKYVLRFFICALTFLALLYLIGFLWKKRKVIFIAEKSDRENADVFLLLCLFLISLFIGIYSFFNNVIRYALPLAPLYLITIAFFLQQIFSAKKSGR